jgi:hypothetical protein
VELYLHYLYTASWRGAQLKAQGQHYIYLYRVNLKNKMYDRIFCLSHNRDISNYYSQFYHPVYK